MLFREVSPLENTNSYPLRVSKNQRVVYTIQASMQNTFSKWRSNIYIVQSSY